MKVKTERIKKDLEVLAKITSTPGKGVTRSSYSCEDQHAKEYLIDQMKQYDLEVIEDGLSTLFGRKESENPEYPVIMIGSHYDSVMNGGAFDGAAGTIAALEVMRILQENKIALKYPVELVAMNAEEGETFGPNSGVTNSRAMVGTLTNEELDTVKNRFGQTKREAMEKYGLYPDFEKAKRKPGSIKNFIELHIEQGPILEKENTKIGIVEYLPGIGRYKVTFNGRSGDSSLLLHDRNDALLASAKFTVALNQMLKKFGSGITGSVNQVEVIPNSNQFVAHFVEAKVEVRTFDKEILKKTDFTKKMISILDEIEMETGVKCTFTEMKRIGYPNPSYPSLMNKENVHKLKEICERMNVPYQILNNGTGHDSMIMSDFTETNMIYVPSKNGISHDPNEWTDYEDIAIGAQVMLELVLSLGKL